MSGVRTNRTGWYRNYLLLVTTGTSEKAKPDRTRPDRTGPGLRYQMKAKRRRRSTLTFPQPVLEVGVTPSLPVEVNAVPDEQGPAHSRSYRARLTAHHNCREPLGSRTISPQFRVFSPVLGGCQEAAERLRAGRTRQDPSGPRGRRQQLPGPRLTGNTATGLFIW